MEKEGHPQPSALEKVREAAERDQILAVLQMTHGKRGAAARMLGISRKTLWKKLKSLGTPDPSAPNGSAAPRGVTDR